jgi:hypothetical protein
MTSSHQRETDVKLRRPKPQVWCKFIILYLVVIITMYFLLDVLPIVYIHPMVVCCPRKWKEGWFRRFKLRPVPKRLPPDKGIQVPEIEMQSLLKTTTLAHAYMAGEHKHKEDLLERIQAYFKDNNPGSLVSNESFEVIADTGASASVTYSRDDFVTDIEPLTGVSMSGIASSLDITGTGDVEWIVYDDSGKARTIRTKAFLIPDLKVRLFSPQSYLREMKKGASGEFVVRAHEAKFVWTKHAVMTMSYAPPVMLPIFRGFRKKTLEAEQGRLMQCVTSEVNENLTSTQKELLRWHYRLGHVAFDRVKWLAQQGFLGEAGRKVG